MEHDKGIEVPSWVAMAAKQRATVYVNGMREPVTIIEAMRLPERKMWAAAVHKEGSKEVSKLVASGVWLWELEEVPRISYSTHTGQPARDQVALRFQDQDQG